MHTCKRRYICEDAVLITTGQVPLPPRRASVNIRLIRVICSVDERSHGLAILEVESFGRLGAEGGNFNDQLVASVKGGAGWMVDGKEGGEGTTTPNRLGDYTGCHFEEGVALHTPA